MANTRDILGDKATLAGLVGNTLTDLEEDSVSTLRDYALADNNALTHIKLVGATSIGQYSMRNCTGLTEIGTNDLPSVQMLDVYAFSGCSNLTSAQFPALTTINMGVFSDCSKLAHLILANNNKVSGNVYVFDNTPIGAGLGAIYVPANLINAYKTDQYFDKFLIVPIDSYPLNSFDTISDSWDTIISYANAGTIGDHYSIGDIKSFTTSDNITYFAQLVGVNKDPLSSDSTRTANSSWLLTRLLSITKTMSNSGAVTTGGWGSCDLRTYLNNEWMLTLPSNIQNAVKTVNKPYYRFEDTSEQVSEDKIWIPSSQELGLTGKYLKETTGVEYTLSSTSGRRLVYLKVSGSANGWWVRTAYSAKNYIYISGVGVISSDGANSTNGILIGFCI